MKTIIFLLLLSISFQSCTCSQLPPKEQEELRERRAEMQAIKLRPER